MHARSTLAFLATVSLVAACGDDGGGSSSGGGGGAGATGATTAQGSPTSSSDGAGSDGASDGDTASAGEGDATSTSSAPDTSSGTGSTGPGGGTQGCGMDSPTGVVPISIDVGGTTRTGILSVPEGYDAATPIPLVFAWHGAGNNGEGARGYFGIEQASAGGAIFVYLDGLPVEGGGSGWDLDTGGIDVALFDAELAAIRAAYCIDDDRVFSTGHSYGGFMTNTVGCARASVLRAIAPVAGGGPFGECDPAGLPALVIHGDPDPVVDFSQGQASLEHWRAQDGCSDSTQPTSPDGCVLYDGCATGPVEFCVHGEGHNWPGIAAQTVWGFFAQF